MLKYLVVFGFIQMCGFDLFGVNGVQVGQIKDYIISGLWLDIGGDDVVGYIVFVVQYVDWIDVKNVEELIEQFEGWVIELGEYQVYYYL